MMNGWRLADTIVPKIPFEFRGTSSRSSPRSPLEMIAFFVIDFIHD